MEKYSVYMHVNKTNGKKYIGMTKNVKERFRSNGVFYKGSKRFYSAIKCYGWDGFDHVVLFDSLTKQEAIEKERQMIAELNTTDENIGYNISEGGEGGRVYKEHPRNRLGTHNPPHEIKRQREFWLDEKNNPMKNGQVVWGVTHEHPRGFEGHHRTEEFKEKMATMYKDNPPHHHSVVAIYPDGRRVRFNCIKEAESIGLTKPTIRKLIDTGEPFSIKARNQYTSSKKHLIGIRFEDDTEVTA